MDARVNRHVGLGAGLVGVLMLVAGTSLGGVAPAQDQDALGGPKVKDNSVPGQARQFAGGSREKGAPRPLPPMAFMRVIGTLDGENAPEGLALSDEQRTQLESIREEHKTLMRVYAEQHKDEVLALRDQLPEPERRRIDGFLNGQDAPGGEAGERGRDGRDGRWGKKGGERPAPEDRPMDGEMMDAPRGERGERAEPSPEALAARQRMREIMEGAPKFEDAHAKAMAVLTPEQQEHVKAKLEEARARAEERRAGGGRREGGPDREKLLEQLSPEEREQLKAMTPEERKAFVREKFGGAAKGEGRGKQPKGK